MNSIFNNKINIQFTIQPSRTFGICKASKGTRKRWGFVNFEKQDTKTGSGLDFWEPLSTWQRIPVDSERGHRIALQITQVHKRSSGILYLVNKYCLLQDMRTVQVDRDESRFWPRHTHGTRTLSVLNTDYLQNFANWDTFYWMELDIPFKQIELASRYEDNSRGQGWYSVLSKLLTRRRQDVFPEQIPSAKLCKSTKFSSRFQIFKNYRASR